VSAEGQIDKPPSKKRLALITGGAFLAAAALVVGVVLPAEFHVDPTGFGRATGLYRLGEPQPKVETVEAGTTSVARYYDMPYRSDVVEIELAEGGHPRRYDELEYKVRMKAGGSIVYSWSVPIENPEEFYYDFHGETPAQGETPAKVVEYKQSTGTSSNGVLIAPIDGVHGWYLQNQSATPVKVTLHLSGFYELVPPGDYGNEAGILPRT